MRGYWVPGILRPDYSWPCPLQNVSKTTPPTPKVSSPLVRRLWGFVHRALYQFSKLYCWAFGVVFSFPICPLPFGLLLKWSNRTSVGEAIATQMVRSAGIPSPKVLCYGEHPGKFERVSILMTRLPGYDLYNSSDTFVPKDEQPLFNELQVCIDAMRQWKSPFPDGTVCSPTGSAIHSIRVPKHVMGPFTSENELLEYLFAPASSLRFDSKEEYEENVVRARKLFELSHPVVFTHGDFKAHNVLVTDDYRLAGIIDWESAGWCPDFWEFTTAMRFGQGSWWYQAMAFMSSNRYATELDADRALNTFTIGSYIGF